MRWPWSRSWETTPITTAVALKTEAIPWPTLVPPELEEWFPVARVCMIGGAMYVIAIATCSKCGAAVALYDHDDFTHLHCHIQWHKELWK